MLISLIKNEFIKLLNGKKLAAFLILIIAAQFVPVLVTYTIKIRPYNGQTYPLSFLGILASWLLPIFLIIVVAEIITDEYKIGMLSNTLIHPVSRFKLITSKAIFLFFLITGILLFSMITAYIIGTMFFHWGEKFLVRSIAYPAPVGIMITLGSYLVSAIPLLAFSLFVMVIASVFNSSALAVGSAAGILSVFFVVGQLVDELRPYLITTYFTYMPHNFFFSNDSKGLFTASLVVGLYGLISYSISGIILHRKDLSY